MQNVSFVTHGWENDNEIKIVISIVAIKDIGAGEKLFTSFGNIVVGIEERSTSCYSDDYINKIIQPKVKEWNDRKAQFVHTQRGELSKTHVGHTIQDADWGREEIFDGLNEKLLKHLRSHELHVEAYTCTNENFTFLRMQSSHLSNSKSWGLYCIKWNDRNTKKNCAYYPGKIIASKEKGHVPSAQVGLRLECRMRELRPSRARARHRRCCNSCTSACRPSRS